CPAPRPGAGRREACARIGVRCERASHRRRSYASGRAFDSSPVDSRRSVRPRSKHAGLRAARAMAAKYSSRSPYMISTHSHYEIKTFYLKIGVDYTLPHAVQAVTGLRGRPHAGKHL